MDSSLLLVHSPLLGPSSWDAAAAVARSQGVTVAVPGLNLLVGDAQPPRWQALADRVVDAAQQLPPPVLVVGHSGAGVLLPSVAAALGERVDGLVFVDAVVPPQQGEHTTSAPLREFLDAQTDDDGLLRSWFSWWPEEMVEQLLPDPADRVALAGGAARVPRDLYDEPVPVPDGWSDQRCSYLRTSPAYETEFLEAGARGWPRTWIHADHLAIHTQPDRVVAEVAALQSRLGATRSEGDGVTVRHARSQDVPALCAFGREHIPPHYAPLIGDDAAEGQVAAWWTGEHFAPAVEAEQVVVAEAAGELVGVAQRGEWDGQPVMWKLYVHPARRGTGLGPRLVDALIADLPADADRLVTEHFAANERAGSFYEREGFRQTSVEPSPDGDPRRATVWRTRPLPRD